MAEPITLYGVPFSQPVRAVMWLMLHYREPFNMVLINPGSKGDNGSRHPNFLAKNPAGTIPTIEQTDGFVLAEAHAILCYLADKHGWADAYPTDIKARAAVNWYLNYHHRNVRDASVGLVAPKIRKDLNIPQAMQDAALATLKSALVALDTGWLSGTRYLAGDRWTIADLAAYVEIGQLKPEFTNVFDFSPYPNVSRWLADMSLVEGHDDVHVVLSELGDISETPPDMDKIKNANKLALKTLNSRLKEMA